MFIPIITSSKNIEIWIWIIYTIHWFVTSFFPIRFFKFIFLKITFNATTYLIRSLCQFFCFIRSYKFNKIMFNIEFNFWIVKFYRMIRNIFKIKYQFISIFKKHLILFLRFSINIFILSYSFRKVSSFFFTYWNSICYSNIKKTNKS